MIRYLFTFIAIFVVGTYAFAQDDSAEEPVVSYGSKFKIQSEVLDEEREMYLWLPENHDPNKKYPVIYALDANMTFQYLTTNAAQFVNTFKTPEIIIVAVTNTNRVRDMTPTNTTIGYDGSEVPQLGDSGGTDNFRKFLSDELIPYVEENYTKSKFRVLYGHSFGGLMVTDVFLDQIELFNAYIAVDPSFWWDNNVMTKLASEKLSGDLDTNRLFYMSKANNSGGTEDKMLPTQNAFEEVVKTKGSSNISFKSEYFENEDHVSVALLTFYNAMMYIFDGYKINVADFPDNPESFEFLDRHFAMYSDKIGHQFTPSERVVNFTAYNYLFAKNDIETAINLFKQNVANYPNSANVYDSLGDAYREKGDKDKARTNYEKALSIDPEYGASKRKLERMDKEASADEE